MDKRVLNVHHVQRVLAFRVGPDAFGDARIDSCVHAGVFDCKVTSRSGL